MNVIPVENGTRIFICYIRYIITVYRLNTFYLYQDIDANTKVRSQ